MSALASFAAAWWETASAQAIQIAIVFVAFAAFDLLLARVGARRSRAALACAFFAKLCLSPALSSPVSVVHLVGAPSAEQASQASVAAAPLALLGVYAAGVAVALLVVARRARAERRAWLDGELREAPADVLALAVRLARTLRLRRVPSIRVGELASGPALIGLFRPIIVLPESLVRAGSRRRLEHVLLHELAHHKRFDPFAHAAWTLATCVYWFHPCVWIAAKRASLLREIGCDELAARCARGGASSYRRTLLEMARPLARGAALSSGFTGGAIVTRLTLLERPLGNNVVLSRFAAGALFACMCLCCVPLGRATSTAPTPVQFSELQGCLRKQYFVLAEIAKEDAAIAALQPR